MKHAVGLIVIREGKVLLVKNTQKSGYGREIYGAPAGRLEDGESEKQAAVREFFEETGLTTTPDDLQEFENNYYEAILKRREGPVEFSIRFFRVANFKGELRPSDETIPEWVELDKAKQMELVANVKEAIEASMKSL